MDWQAVTDRALKACLQVFGELIEYHPIDALAYSIPGVFEASYQEVQPDGQIVQSTQPKLSVRMFDLIQEPQPGDKVLYRGRYYRVVEYQPDGQGSAVLYLMQ